LPHWAAFIKLTRSKRSERAPVRGPATGRKRLRQTPIRATSQGEPVSSRATQPVTVISIKRAKFQAKVEIQRRR
jgi:hypothetical protein